MKKRKFLSAILVLALTFSLIPAVPTYAGKESSSTQVVAGVDVTFVIKADNSLWSWGHNAWGQLGDGTDKDRDVPVKIMDNVKSVYVEEKAYSTYVMAVKLDGTLWAWGSFNYGQFGDGTTESRYSPVKIMDGVDSVSFGEGYTLILKTDGSLYGCGSNNQGQLGDGTGESKYKPVRIMDEVVSVAAGYSYAAAVKKDGSLWMWGANLEDKLGNGVLTDVLKPFKVMDGVTSVSVVFDSIPYTLAVKKDGTLWTWGTVPPAGYKSEIIKIPVKIMDNVLSVTMGKDYAMAIKTDNSLWSWGKNSRGELGNGTKEDTFTPTKILENVTSVSLSGHGVQYTHVQAIKTDGSLWAWGSNEGKLGDGTQLDRYAPVKILDGVVATSAGSAHGVAVKSDGSLWAWGSTLMYNPSIELQQVKKVETTAKYYDKIYAVFSERRVDKGFVLRYAWTDEYAAFGDNKKIYEQAKSITAGLTDDYEKARAIYDWMCKNITYDISLAGKVNANSALSVLQNKKAVCEGYSKLTEALLRASGIPARVISSVPMDHAWNEAFIDGRWIILDTTWGSTGGDSAAKRGVTWDSTAEDRAKKVGDKYFDPLLEEISKTHIYGNAVGASKNAVVPMKMMDGVKLP